MVDPFFLIKHIKTHIKIPGKFQLQITLHSSSVEVVAVSWHLGMRRGFAARWGPTLGGYLSVLPISFFSFFGTWFFSDISAPPTEITSNSCAWAPVFLFGFQVVPMWTTATGTAAPRPSSWPCRASGRTWCEDPMGNNKNNGICSTWEEIYMKKYVGLKLLLYHEFHSLHNLDILDDTYVSKCPICWFGFLFQYSIFLKTCWKIFVWAHELAYDFVTSFTHETESPFLIGTSSKILGLFCSEFVWICLFVPLGTVNLRSYGLYKCLKQIQSLQKEQPENKQYTF